MKLRIRRLSEDSVVLSDFTVWPMPDRRTADGDSLEWKLRYGDGTTRQGEAAPELLAARYVHAWTALMAKTPEQRAAITEAIARAVKRRRRETP